MNEYNNSIEELLKDFEELQIREIVKQVNTNTGAPTGSVGSNFNPDNYEYEQGEPSTQSRGTKTSFQKYTKGMPHRKRRTTITEEFQPKNPLDQEPIPAWGYFLNIDCVTDIRKALDTWKASMILALMSEPSYAAEDRDVNVIYSLLINSFQGIVYNWYNGVSSHIKTIIEIDVKRKLRVDLEEGVWTLEKYLIGQFEGYEFIQTTEQAYLEKRQEALYKLTNLRICNLCNYKSFFCEFNKYYYALYDSTENQETYIQLLLNKFPNPWNRYFSEKFEIFAREPTVFRSVAAVQTIINREMIKLCQEESRRRYIKEVTLCCDDVKEPGQYGCKNYPNYTPKRKRTTKTTFKKSQPRKPTRKEFSKKKPLKSKSKAKRVKTEKSVNKPQKTSKHFKHENFTQENFNPENRYYKRNKKPTTCQCWNCEEIEHKSIDCHKRKANIVKLFSEEFEEIQEELYTVDPTIHEVISSCYESISSESYTDSTESLEESESEDEY